MGPKQADAHILLCLGKWYDENALPTFHFSLDSANKLQRKNTFHMSKNLAELQGMSERGQTKESRLEFSL